MERLKPDDSERLKSIEGIRLFFADPRGERKTEISRLSSLASQTMQEIYQTEGNLSLMSPEIAGWLQESMMLDFRDGQGVGNIETVLGQILARERSTRRFDEKFFGQIHPQGNEIAIISDFIAAYMNTNTVYNQVSLAENLMEEESLDWLAEMFGYETEKFSGNIVTDGTEANETAFWVAREWAKKELESEGRDSQTTKLYAIGSEAKHYSVVKVCHKLGLEFVQIPEKDFKTNPEAMKQKIQELDLVNGKIALVLGIAGGTETGIVDDLNALLKIAQENKAHFHVDAAYGGPYILTKESYRFSGIKEADSITIDPHKMLYTPYNAGVILFKDRDRHELITADFVKNAGYLENHEEHEQKKRMSKSRSYGNSRPSGSLGSGGAISTWATMKLFGNEGIKTILDHTLKLTDYANQRILRSNVLVSLFQPELNTIMIALKDKDKLSQKENNEAVDKAMAHAWTKGYYISCDNEISHGMKVLRFLPMHPYSTQENVDELFDLLEESLQK